MILDDAETPISQGFGGCLVRVLGPLSSMPVSEACRRLERQGARVTETLADATVIVVGDGVDLATLRRDAAPSAGAAPEVLTEPLFLRRLMGDGDAVGVRGLHPPAALAEILAVPVGAIRRWARRGYLRPTRRVGSLPLYDFTELQVARRLASLLAAGCSLATIDALVARLESNAAGVDRPLVSLALEVGDGRLLIRRRTRLMEPGGQTMLDFDCEPETPADQADPMVPFPAPLADDPPAGGRAADSGEATASRARAWELAERGDLAAAKDACRLVLLSGHGRAEDHFLLAHLLYEEGDAAGARERYFAALEHDDAFVEARINLACLMSEQGDARSAVALLEGAVGCEPDSAETRYHLADMLDRQGRHDDADPHWRRLIELDPATPWAETARSRLAVGGRLVPPQGS